MKITPQMNPDELLWKIAINDDKEAFRTLFDLFYPALCIHAKRFVEDRAVAEDLVQDVFVILWENRKKVKIELSVRKYLIASVKNQSLRHLKREGYKQDYIETYLSKNADISDYNEFYLLTELQKLLEEALARLPETYRLIFEMSRLENKSNTEIAETLDIPLRTVERYKAKIIDILKKDLKDYLPLLLYCHLLN